MTRGGGLLEADHVAVPEEAARADGGAASSGPAGQERAPVGAARRTVLRLAPVFAAGAAAAACADPPPAPGPAPVPPPAPQGPGGGGPALWAGTTGMHAARRLTWGATPSLAAEIDRIGLQKWLERQINWRAIDDSRMAGMLAPWPRPDMSAPALDADSPWRIAQELAAHETLRRCFSGRQLHELMVDFWSDHFNVHVHHGRARVHMGTYMRDVIRPHALGRFRDLLPAVGRHPAMLHYLDQAGSRADRGRIPNENYAREAMELHTVGSGAGYSQQDVVAVSYLLTGWTTDGRTGGIEYRADWHDAGPMVPARQVLGWSRGSLSGDAAALSFMHHLATHPATARRVCHKLARRLVGEHVAPNSPLVDTAVSAYNSSGTDVAAVVRALVLSREFAESGGAKVRRPQSLVTQYVRALGVGWTQPANPDSFLWKIWGTLEQLGNANHAWPAPNGYPDASNAWLSVGALLARWNAAVYLAHGTVAGLGFDARATMDWSPDGTWGGWLTALADRIAGEAWPDGVRAAVLAEYGVTEQTTFRNWDHWAAPNVVVVLLQTAGFQRS